MRQPCKMCKNQTNNGHIPHPTAKGTPLLHWITGLWHRTITHVAGLNMFVGTQPDNDVTKRH